MTDRRWRWIVNLLVLLSLVGVTLAGINSQRAASRTDRLANCVSVWATDYTHVTQTRSDANTIRVNALHKLLLDVIQSPAQMRTNMDQLALIDALASGDTETTLKAAGVYAKDLEFNRGNPIVINDVLSFISTETNYQKTIRNHPLPEPPKEVCHG